MLKHDGIGGLPAPPSNSESGRNGKQAEDLSGHGMYAGELTSKTIRPLIIVDFGQEPIHAVFHTGKALQVELLRGSLNHLS